MKIKLLKDIVGHVAGKNAINIVDLLADKKNVNEFLIAKKLNMTINQTRNILYKLSEEHLVSFTRKKDKRKGWYTYFWTINTGRMFEFLKKMVMQEKAQLQSQLHSRETKRFYVCKNCHIEVGEETALLNDFTCIECGEVYELNADETIKKELGNKIRQFGKDLDFIEQEIKKEDDIKKKKNDRQMRKEEREKRKAKEKNAAERKKAKEKELKKLKRKNKKVKAKIKRLIKKVKKIIKKAKKRRK
jgi:transcription factor E